MMKMAKDLRNNACSHSLVRAWEYVRGNSYYIAFFLFCVWTWLSRSSFIDGDGATSIKLIEKIMQVIVLALLGGAFIRTRATVYEFSYAMVLILLGFIVWRTSGEGWLFWLTLFIVCGKGTKLGALSCIALVSALLVGFLAGTASAAGLIENNIVVRASTGEIRNPMGFDHPNTLGAAMLVISASLYLGIENKRHKKGLLIAMVFCIMMACITFFVAGSRTAGLCLIIFALAIPLYVLMKGRPWAYRASAVLAVLFVCIVAISVGYMVFYDPSRPFDSMLNNILSGRIRLLNMYYLAHSPGLLGYDYAAGPVICVDGKELAFVVDNLYGHVLLRHGLVAFAIFVVSIIALCIKMYKEKYFGPLLFGMGLFLVYGVSETLGCRVECNFFIISLWTVLYHRPISDFDCVPDSTGAISSSEGVSSDEISLREFVMLPFTAMGSHRD